MRVVLADKAYEFVPWRPELGQVFVAPSGYAFQCATGQIDEHHHWLLPPFVIGTAFDGMRGYFVQKNDVAAFFMQHSRLPVIMHDAAQCLAIIHQMTPGMDIYQMVENNQVWDTQLLHVLSILGTTGEVSEGRNEADLDHCVRKYLQFELPTDAMDSKGDKVRLSYSKWLNRNPREMESVYLECLAKNVIATNEIYQVLQRHLNQMLFGNSAAFGFISTPWLQEQIARWGPQTHHIQLKASIVLKEITKNGMHLDIKKKDELRAFLQEKLKVLHEQLRQLGYLAGERSSHKALQAALKQLDQRHGLSLPRTGQGHYAVSREALEEFAGTEPFIKLLLEYHETESLLNAFVSKMNKGVLHPSFNVLVKTGRTSSFGEINAQNLPKDQLVRACFIPSPGNVFLDCDFKTIELVTLAQACLRQFGFVSQMATAINHGKDLHTMVAARVKKCSEAEVSSEDRNRAKAINFGKPGGMGNKALQKYAKTTFGIEMSAEGVDSLSAAWDALFPEMEYFLKDKLDVGLEVAKLFHLTPDSYQCHTGQTWWHEGQDPQQADSILGWMLLKTIRDPAPTTGAGRRYNDRELDFFWSSLGSQRQLLSPKFQHFILNRQPFWLLSEEVRKLADTGGVYTLSGRLRAKANYSARHNTIFQGLAADGAKLALWNLWRAGFRIVNFIHDQVLIEIPDNCDYESESIKVRRWLVAGMRAIVPDVEVDVQRPKGALVKRSWGS